MFYIDSLAGRSRLNKVHPAEKLLLTLSVIIFSLFTQNFVLPVAAFFCMSFCIVLLAGISVKLYLKLLAIPLTFICLSIIPLLISLEPGAVKPLVQVKIFTLYIGITELKLKTSLLFGLKSFASISGFYFFILTTPFYGLEYLLKKARLPLFIREIILLTYRYIFVFINLFRQIRLSQDLRGGYIGIKRSLRSTAESLVMLFRRMLQFCSQSAMAMEARGNTGQICFLQADYAFSLKNWFFILVAIILQTFLLIGAG